MTAATKNVKCTPEALDNFDKLMMSERYPPKHRPEMFERMVKGYAEYQKMKLDPPTPIPEVVEKIVYVETTPKQISSIKKTLISCGNWLAENTNYFPTSHNKKVRSKITEIIESANSL